MIKFDQPKELTAEQIIQKHQTQISGPALVLALEQSGYRIVKERDYRHLLDANEELDRQLRNKS